MVKKELENIIREVASTFFTSPPDFSNIVLARPSHKKFGDYTTNVALVLTEQSKSEGEFLHPIALAEKIAEMLKETLFFREKIALVEVAGPGFINFTLNKTGVESALAGTLENLDSGYEFLLGEYVNIEFVSVNPTGQFHIGHGRGVFFGDVLARVLDYAGASIVREYYINDSKESNQIRELGKTALGKGEQYKTPWLEKLMVDTVFDTMSEEEAGFTLSKKIQDHNKDFLEKALGIFFDVWFSEEAEIRETSRAVEIKARLEKSGHIYEKDGALWLRTSAYGDDEDRVLVRSDQSATYFLADIAYHENKFARGFTKVIDIWGADHHGHVKRIQATGKMLDWPPAGLLIFITQLVGVKKGEVLERMSKRRGNVIYLEDIVAELGGDVTRWFFLEKTLSSHFEFDLDLAREKSEKNPVFYVQYAHARMCSVIKNTHGLSRNSEKSFFDILEIESARSLALKISEFPEVIEKISREYSVHILPQYAHELATSFSLFYRDVRVIEGRQYSAPAFELVLSAKNVLNETLVLLGISTPEKM